jgi:hypothetical protein
MECVRATCVCAGTACGSFLISPTPSWPRERILCGTSAAGDTLIIFNKSCFPWAPHIIVVCAPCVVGKFRFIEKFFAQKRVIYAHRARLCIYSRECFILGALREALAQAVIARRLRKLCVRSSFIRAIYPPRQELSAAAAAAYVLFRSWAGPSPGCSAEISRLENFRSKKSALALNQ